MPRLIVIFDANAYIGISTDEMAQLIVRERSNGVVAWASYFVVDELIARAGDKDARRSGGGAWALKKLADHCAAYDGSVERVNFVADPRYQVAEFIFRQALPRQDQKVIDTYGTVVKAIASDPTKKAWPDWVGRAAAQLANEITAREVDFAKAVWDNVVETLATGAKAWADVKGNHAASKALAAGIASTEGLDLCANLFAAELGDLIADGVSEHALTKAAEILRSAFPLPLRIFNDLQYRVALEGLDVSQPAVANTIWDMQLAFSVPISSQVAQTPVWIVTSDKAFHRAAQNANAHHLIRSLDEYLDLTKRPDMLRAEIDRFFADPDAR